MKFPYGIMDFSSLISEDYIYVDRTHFIPECEDIGKVLFCVRPHRFGKTLWLNTLRSYYDILRKNKFESLFSQLYIGKNPTQKRSSYLIFHLDFSKIKVSDKIEVLENNFEDYINDQVASFIKEYFDFLEPIKVSKTNCLSSVDRLLDSVYRNSYKLYVFIDEYDNFTNELIATSQNTEYSRLVTGQGLIKSFFKVLKSAMVGAVDRIFVTGISPITLTDLSSSFNISTNLFNLKEFNTLFGFTEKEVKGLLSQVLEEKNAIDRLEEILSIIKHYYNGYLFAKNTQESVYNPTMTLYFLRALQRNMEFPDPFYDNNLEMDTNKMEHITKLSSTRQKVFQVLSNNEEVVVKNVVSSFKLEDLLNMDEQNDDVLWSYLYYNGVLTHAGMDIFYTKLKIPNVASKKFYYNRIRDSLFPKSLDLFAIQKDFFLDLKVEKLEDYLENTLLVKLSNRDYLQANELSVKIMFLSVMMRDDIYLIDSEKELLRG